MDAGHTMSAIQSMCAALSRCALRVRVLNLKLEINDLNTETT